MSKITILTPASTDIPLSLLLTSARRILTECEDLDTIVIKRHGIAITIIATVQKVYPNTYNKLVYQIHESFESVQNSVEDIAKHLMEV